MISEVKSHPQLNSVGQTVSSMVVTSMMRLEIATPRESIVARLINTSRVARLFFPGMLSALGLVSI